jgi:hypothetical protein
VVLEAGLRSRGDYWLPTDETNGTSVAAGVARFTRVCVLDRPWQAAQVTLAKSLHARQVFARQSQHYIMFGQPGVIIRAIRGAVRAVRRER